MEFKLESKFKPAGDQPHAIEALVSGLEKGFDHQTLLGVTGSGKTFTIANVIERVQKPTLVIAHNKTLAAQLANEFRELFPKNSVNYFVSYYDYYQPEAYMPVSDTYIVKEAMVNDEIDKLRHAATTALLTRRDVIVVASVSCIYGLGAPEVYAKNILRFAVGEKITRAELVRKLVSLQFSRTNADLKRGTFRLRGDNWEIMPPDREFIYNFELKDDVIIAIYEINPVQGFKPGETPSFPEIYIAPARHYITETPERDRAAKTIKEELKEQLKYFESNGKLLEAERLERRTKFDLAMIKEIGYCNGIENYSRHLSGRAAGEAPSTLLDYFVQERGQTRTGRRPSRKDYSHGRVRIAGGLKPEARYSHADFLTVIDESHVTVPQIGGMYEGDASRKRTLIEYGFRLPSAADNRPLKFNEFSERVGQVIYTSATPGAYERKRSMEAVEQLRRQGVGVPTGTSGIIEQLIRPTGLVDPKITIRPVRGQVQDIVKRIEERVGRKERVLVTTLTKKMAEDLAEYLGDKQAEGSGGRAGGKATKVAYLHSDVATLDRIKILTSLRRGDIDVLVGVNLLREGLDLPEVSLVGILDADKEGFLRSETSLIQTIGRAARNVNGEVVMYADVLTGSIKRAIGETERRRKLQLAYNEKHGITPKTIEKKISNILPIEDILDLELKVIPKSCSSLEQLIRDKEREMKEAAQRLDFELAAILRDELRVLYGKIHPGARPAKKHKKV